MRCVSFPCTCVANLWLIVGGSTASWYTNPQTEALCKLLGIENKINPMPAGFREARAAAATISALSATSPQSPVAPLNSSTLAASPVVEISKAATNGQTNGVVPSAADELAAAKKAAMAELDSLVVAEAGNEDEIVMDDEDI